MRAGDPIVVRQRGATDCGHACLVALLRHQRILSPSVESLLNKKDLQPLSPSQIVSLAADFGLELEQVHVPFGCLAADDSPFLPSAVLVRGEPGASIQHYVVAWSYADQAFEVMDPGTGSWTVPQSHFFRELLPVSTEWPAHSYSEFLRSPVFLGPLRARMIARGTSPQEVARRLARACSADQPWRPLGVEDVASRGWHQSPFRSRDSGQTIVVDGAIALVPTNPPSLS